MNFQGGSMQKNKKFQGGHDKFDWKSRGVNVKKIDILNRGGLQFFTGKAQLSKEKTQENHKNTKRNNSEIYFWQVTKIINIFTAGGINFFSK